MKIFKSKQDNMTTNELILEIHESFNTEVDRILEEANIKIALPETDKDIIDKGRRLDALGFNKTIDATEAGRQKKLENEAKETNDKKDRLRKTVLYFSQKYPLYKFITEDSVKSICAKYNLIYGDVSNYTGDVPDKNLKEIEAFEIDENDKCWEEHRYSHFSFEDRFIGHLSNKHVSIKRERRPSEYDSLLLPPLTLGTTSYILSKMEIAAPIKDFDTEKMDIKDFKISKIEIPDPIVLQPVFHDGQKHYLIITAWGEEASDDAALNPIHN